MKLNRRNALDRYNNMYSREFLFEEVMFTWNERKLNEMKLYLLFFISHFNNKALPRAASCAVVQRASDIRACKLREARYAIYLAASEQGTSRTIEGANTTCTLSTSQMFRLQRNF